MIEWRVVPNWPRYEVSEYGDVRTIATQRIRRTVLHRGYKAIILFDTGRNGSLHIAWIVAAAFIGPRPKGYTVNHIDGNKRNNHYSNLEYCTVEENNAHAKRTGLLETGPRHWSNRRPELLKYGMDHHSSKLTDDAVRDIRKRYIPRRNGPALAKEYGVSIQTISLIVTNKTWTHVNSATSEEVGHE